MLQVVLYQPEIPPNTGNIIRLCANTGAKLHLIEPLGFSLDDKQLKRAGLDYHEHTSISIHQNYSDFLGVIQQIQFNFAHPRNESSGGDQKGELPLLPSGNPIGKKPAACGEVLVNNLFACSTKGTKNYTDVAYEAGDVFLFGPETRGLPKDILSTFAPNKIIRIPMLPHSRSLNLSNAVAIIIYEAWRQLGFRSSINNRLCRE